MILILRQHWYWCHYDIFHAAIDIFTYAAAVLMPALSRYPYEAQSHCWPAACRWLPADIFFSNDAIFFLSCILMLLLFYFDASWFHTIISLIIFRLIPPIALHGDSAISSCRRYAYDIDYYRHCFHEIAFDIALTLLLIFSIFPCHIALSFISMISPADYAIWLSWLSSLRLMILIRIMADKENLRHSASQRRCRFSLRRH